MNKYNIIRKIANGSYGDVFLGKIKDKEVVIKKLFTKNDLERESCKIINELQCKYFVNFIEKIGDNIIYDYFNGNVLLDELYYLNNDDIKKISFELIDFLHTLELKNYYYLDLNLNNILIDDKKNIKIIDYSTINHKKSKINCKIGTYYFAPHEYILDNIIIKDKFDIFSFGIILFNLLLKYMPIKKISDYKKKCLCENKCDLDNCLLNILKKYNKVKNNELLINLLINSLQFNYQKRSNINQIYNLIKNKKI